MVRPDRELLGGDGVAVEVDQTFLGGIAPGKSRSGPRYANKAEVVIAVERTHPKGLGRARLAHISTEDRKADLLEFIRANIAHGTILYTDGDPSYAAAAKTLQLRHEAIVMNRNPQPAHALLPAVHRVAALLKRWIAGTLHDRVSDQHLAYYLDEFTFRFNRRNSRSRGLLWYRLVQQAVDTDPHPLSTLHHKT